MIHHDLAGRSQAMADVVRLIAKAAPANSSVLICGESGTGKELAARALHRNSRRAAGPFVAVNCAALPETLLESELFGHEKGAFTGAVAPRKGKFQMAAGGTLFLDEVGELSAWMQAKLLRAIQERTVDRIGCDSPVRVDVRFIAATNRDLAAAIARGEFRADLYYRLRVVVVRMPPLRERREDVAALARIFVSRHAEENGVATREISEDALAILERYDWPGNVRELQNTIEEAMVLGSPDTILPQDLPLQIVEPASQRPQYPRPGLRESLAELERRLYEEAFTAARGDYVKASEILKVNPKGIHRALKNLGLTYLLR